ncbi:hypothetical protein AMJ71_00970 [candidate division TA06 bacterium SM1_40]|uniref:N-acetyltransferase domain-containing protein n=2 Tax=Bacteria division TA06 TaxID=1156500 RepID=A0A0S8JNV7_UNCT6|nr:MAG: hypothetical protein AMJ82_04905 [candidate division TA06 bacterium SM23_40]KPL11431.1 MAG: hypothetical protein AMJ71_00970 [candidate division TA06 bacterium SM1_40]
MGSIEIRNMDPATEYFVGTCTHVGDDPQAMTRDEIDVSSPRRIAWLRKMSRQGARTKVATIEGEPVGFIHVIPIEICPWGPLGRDLLVIPCLVSLSNTKGRGVGKALVATAEEEARHREKKGIVTVAYYHDCWFMPAPFFEECGFSLASRREGTALLWKLFDQSAEAPRLLERDYRYTPVPGKVVVDLFWNTFCPTSSIEARRVRKVVEEFGESVVLNEYCADDREILLLHQLPRGIFVNGREIWWGHEAPEEGIRKAILEASSRA